MTVGLTYDLDLSAYTDREQVEAGEKVPADWYRTVLSEHYEDHNKEGQFVFEFKVNGGLYDGKKLFYRLTDPRYMDDEGKAKMARSRIGIVASRLGLIRDEDLGKPNTSVDFDQAVGHEFVVRVQEQTNKTSGETFSGIGYVEIYPLDHPKLPKDVRAKLQLPPARDGGKGGSKAAAGAAGQAAKDDFSDL
jgi:hypothetical protein